MSNRSYGQYCGLARALEMVGERWALLIVRDLLVGPRRFSDLRRGLAKIPSNVLSGRLKELEESGVVRRRLLARPETGFEYELTEYGRGMEEAVLALGRWGACSLGDPRAGERVTTDSMIMALRTTFQPQAARGVSVSYALHLGDLTIHARIDDGALTVGAGPLADADLIIETGPALRGLLAGEISAAAAVQHGDVHLTGERALFDTFLDLFQIRQPPVQAAS
jgi:DNA-binding HxlR family transcriptional regulator